MSPYEAAETEKQTEQQTATITAVPKSDVEDIQTQYRVTQNYDQDLINARPFKKPRVRGHGSDLTLLEQSTLSSGKPFSPEAAREMSPSFNSFKIP